MFMLDRPQHLAIALSISGIQGQRRMLGGRYNNPSLSIFSPDHCFILVLGAIPIIGRRSPWHASKSKHLFETGKERKATSLAGMGRCAWFPLGGQDATLPPLDSPKTEERCKQNKPAFGIISTTDR